MPTLVNLGVDLLEQPVKVGFDDGLQDYQSPIPICADESINTADDLPKLVGRYSFINIKLDKPGGLTNALEIAHAAPQLGSRTMRGWPLGRLTALAPPVVLVRMVRLAQRLEGKG